MILYLQSNTGKNSQILESSLMMTNLILLTKIRQLVSSGQLRIPVGFQMCRLGRLNSESTQPSKMTKKVKPKVVF